MARGRQLCRQKCLLPHKPGSRMVDVICLCFLQPGEGDFLSFFFCGGVGWVFWFAFWSVRHVTTGPREPPQLFCTGPRVQRASHVSPVWVSGSHQRQRAGAACPSSRSFLEGAPHLCQRLPLGGPLPDLAAPNSRAGCSV